MNTYQENYASATKKQNLKTLKEFLKKRTKGKEKHFGKKKKRRNIFLFQKMLRDKNS